eukprot:gene32333-43191_t
MAVFVMPQNTMSHGMPPMNCFDWSYPFAPICRDQAQHRSDNQAELERRQRKGCVQIQPDHHLRYSALALLKAGLTGQRHWPRAWRDPAPRKHYDVIIIGGGGHGLSTAYYLAKVHGVKSIAVLEKGWIGGGNTGRNTTIVRSNYRQPALHNLFDFALGLWEGMSDELNYNVMFSPRGALFLGHSDSDMTRLAERGDALRCNGIDAELLTRAQVQHLVPLLDMSPDARFPIHGGMIQRRGGTARHDAVAWGYARAASALGVDIIQNCEHHAVGVAHEQLPQAGGRHVVAAIIHPHRDKARHHRVAADTAKRDMVQRAGRTGRHVAIHQARRVEPVEVQHGTSVVVVHPPRGFMAERRRRGARVEREQIAVEAFRAIEIRRHDVDVVERFHRHMLISPLRKASRHTTAPHDIRLRRIQLIL